GADDFGVVFLFVFAQGNLDFVRIFHHVIGRQNITVGRHDDAGAEGAFPPREFATVVRPEELAEKRVVEHRVAHGTQVNDVGGVDVHDAGRGLFDHRGKTGAEFGVAV